MSSLARLHRLVTGRTNAKGVTRQWAEMLALWVLRGNGPGLYQMGGFWRPELTWRDISRHMSYREYLAFVDRVNPRDYRKVSAHKVTEKAVLSLLGFPTPRFIGFYDPVRGRDGQGRPLRSVEDLERLLSRDAAQRVCFKLLEGHGGRGFVAVTVDRTAGLRFALLGGGQETARSPTRLDTAGLLASLGTEPRVIEEYLSQDPTYAQFNPTSVNTLRIWVLREQGRTRAKLAFLRIGRRGSLVDNRSAGGIVAPVDIATGRLSAGLDGKPSRVVYEVHPDSHARIEGVVLPRFAEAAELAEACLDAFPRMQFAGMDVAMTPDGPCIIESNVQPDRSGAVHVGIPTRDVFGL